MKVALEAGAPGLEELIDAFGKAIAGGFRGIADIDLFRPRDAFADPSLGQRGCHLSTAEKPESL